MSRAKSVRATRVDCGPSHAHPPRATATPTRPSRKNWRARPAKSTKQNDTGRYRPPQPRTAPLSPVEIDVRRGAVFEEQLAAPRRTPDFSDEPRAMPTQRATQELMQLLERDGRVFASGKDEQGVDVLLR